MNGGARGGVVGEDSLHHLPQLVFLGLEMVVDGELQDDQVGVVGLYVLRIAEQGAPGGVAAHAGIDGGYVGEVVREPGGQQGNEGGGLGTGAGAVRDGLAIEDDGDGLVAKELGGEALIIRALPLVGNGAAVRRPPGAGEAGGTAPGDWSLELGAWQGSFGDVV